MNQLPTTPTPNPKRWGILFATMTAGIMGPIDGSIVNVAMPTFSKVFAASLHEVGWISMSYLLVIGSLILTFGRLGDMFGYKRIFLFGIAAFTLSSLLCALSPNLWTLVAFRALQALGAGMFMAMGPAIVTSVFPPQERGRAMGVNGMFIAVGLAAGPTLGGLLITAFSWHSIFLINLPVGLIGFLLAWRLIPRDGAIKPQKFDWLGAASGFIALASFLLTVSYGGDWGWTSPLTLSFGTLFFLSFAFFLNWEKKIEHPMLDLSLFRHKVFSSANFAALMNFMALFMTLFLIPFYLQQLLNYGPGRIGLILSISPLISLVLSPLSGYLSDHWGTRLPAFLGQALVSLALFLLSSLDATSHPLDIIWRLAIFGLGIGIFQSPNSSAVMGSVPRHRLGIGSGVLATVRNVGMVLGIAVSSGLFAWLYHGPVIAGAVNAPEFIQSLQTTFIVGGCLAIVGCFATLARGSGTPSSAPGEPSGGSGPQRPIPGRSES